MVGMTPLQVSAVVYLVAVAALGIAGCAAHRVAPPAAVATPVSLPCDVAALASEDITVIQQNHAVWLTHGVPDSVRLYVQVSPLVTHYVTLGELREWMEGHVPVEEMNGSDTAR